MSYNNFLLLVVGVQDESPDMDLPRSPGLRVRGSSSDRAEEEEGGDRGE